MENQTNQQSNNKNSETKRQSGQPTYGDKPWQTPQEESCGCSSEKGNKKEQTSAKNR